MFYVGVKMHEGSSQNILESVNKISNSLWKDFSKDLLIIGKPTFSNQLTILVQVTKV